MKPSKCIGLALLALLPACSAIRPFPERAPLWKDTQDFRTYSAIPAEHKAATIWDGVSETILRPIPSLLAVNPAGRAVDVNSVDEVPDSSWFTNRIGQKTMPLEEIAKGACAKPIDPKGPFEVLSAKPDGFNPGFLVKAPDGRKYFFKFDQHELQPERMSMAEVIGSLIYHSVGFTVPCYEVLYFDRAALVRGKSAMMKNERGEKIPMTDAFIDEAFKLVKLATDGKVRGVASLLLEGKSLGPWQYAGVDEDDPNDVIPHEERREVRAGYVLASWLSHFDTRDQNTMRTWMTDKGSSKGYVRHNILDFGDGLGNLTGADELSRRLGYSYYFDLPYMVRDFATLGVVERPWDRVKYGPGGPVLGYYDVENFVPDEWSPGYPNPAFNRMVESDAAWMARIIAEFRDPQIEAIVAMGKIKDEAVEAQLLSTLIGRRDKLLTRWFRNISPLTHPDVKSTPTGLDVCVRDLALYAGTIGTIQRRYETRLLAANGELLGEKFRSTRAAEMYCVHLPSAALATYSYSVVEIAGRSSVNPSEKPLRLHLYRAKSAWKIAGLERLE